MHVLSWYCVSRLTLTHLGPATGYQLPGASYSDPNISTLDLGKPFFQYSPQSTASLSSGDALDFDFSALLDPQTGGGFEFDVRVPSPVQSFPLLAGPSSMQESHIMYYFENVRRLHFLFGGNEVTNVVYTVSILSEAWRMRDILTRI